MWIWPDGEPVASDPNFWAPNEPNDVKNEDCASIYATKNKNETNDYLGKWNDLSCKSKSAFACEFSFE